MLRATLKSLLSRKLRLALSAVAVLLGVTFVSGAFVLTDTLGRSFDAMFASINQSIDVQVTAKRDPDAPDAHEAVTATVPGDAVETVRQVEGVETAEGVVLADGARLIDTRGKVVVTFGPPRFGSNWTGDRGLVELREGRGPEAPDEIAVNAALAEASGYEVGDRAGVLTLQPKKTFTIVGIFGYSGNRDTLGGTHEISFTLPVAQELMLGQKDAFTTVDVVAADGVSQTTLRDRIRSALGPSYDVRTAEEVAEEQASDIKEGLRFFNYILLGFAGVALFVGVFLILNTFSMLIAQRTRELALFRAIGASRRQLIGSVLLEAVVIGALASVVGLACGIGVGAGLAAAFSAFSDSNLDLTLAVPPSAVVAALVVGLGVTLVAALMPALRASRIPPIAAMRDAATPDRPLTTVTATGAAVFAVGGGLLGWALTGDAGDATLWTLLGGVLVAFVGVALLTPVLSRPVVSVLGRAFSWSVPGTLGRRNSARNPRRTAITAAALMVSIALVTAVSTLLTSATTSIGDAVEKTVKADLIIAGQQTGPLPPVFDRNAVPATAELPGVRTVAAFYSDFAKVNGKEQFVAAVNDLAAVRTVLGMQAKAGDLDGLRDDELVVDDQTARENDLSVGDTVLVRLSRGEGQRYTVRGTYERSSAAQGFLLPESSSARFRTPSPSSALIQLEPGADVAAVRAQVEKVLENSPEVAVQDGSAFVRQQTAIFDTILVMIQILLALATLIAVLGIVNTLALSVIERTREIGLLRAIGLRRSQTMRMITVESVVISVFGALLGVAVGVGLGAAVVRALRDEGFTTLSLPWTQMGAYLLLGAVIGVVAAILPAVRAARLNVLNAIAYE